MKEISFSLSRFFSPPLLDHVTGLAFGLISALLLLFNTDMEQKQLLPGVLYGKGTGTVVCCCLGQSRGDKSENILHL